MYIRDLLMERVPAVDAGARFSDIADYFQQRAGVQLCVVVDEHQMPIGFISQHKFQAMVASPHGYALYERQAAAKFMETSLNLVHTDEDVSSAMHRINRDDEVLRSGVIVVSGQGQFAGLLSSVVVFRTLLDLHDRILDKLKAEVAERQRAESEIKALADRDSLTGILNRRSFLREVSARIGETKPFSCAFLDLDRFKLLNDRFGHSIGDEVLQGISQRLLQTEGVSLAARLGGDEFAFVLDQPGDDREAHRQMTVIHSHMTSAIRTKAGLVGVGASIGYARFPNDANDTTSLLHAADKSMLRCKSGGGGAERFSLLMDRTGPGREDFEGAVTLAVSRECFRPALQPIFDTSTGAVVGMEMLARWPNSGFTQHPSPGQFIPVIERLGLIDTLFWSLTRMTLAEKESENLFLSVNVSASQLTSMEFVDNLEACLQEFDCPAEKIELEVTETVFFRNLDKSREILGAVRELGVSLALDDFGTGYSSLAMIDSLPFSKIKIDKSLVNDITDNPAKEKILKATIALCRELNLTSCVEGVETAEQLERLKSIGCDQVQGFFLGRPALLEMTRRPMVEPLKLVWG